MIDNDFIAHESGTDTEGRSCARWEAWVAKVERLAGIATLDGNGDEDGYCLYFALNAYEAGTTAEAYAAKIREIIASAKTKA